MSAIYIINLLFRVCGGEVLNFMVPAAKYVWQTLVNKYSARRLIGSRIIESAAYCNQKLLAHLYINNTQNTSVN